MNVPNGDTFFLSRAIRPDLFSASHYPELLFALFLANLMSERLDELAGKVVKVGDRTPAALDHAMHRMHKYVNHRFYHPKPMELARVWGLHEFERRTTPEEIAEDAMSRDVIRQGLEIWRHEKDPRLHLLTDGAFPNYIYSNIDLILSCGRRFDYLKVHPLGMTSCVDECLLIASLAVAGGLCGIGDLVLVGSPFHYTLFIIHENNAWWINGKREIFNAEEFAKACPGTDNNSRQNFFDARTVVVDRLITAAGSTLFTEGRSTLHPDRLDEILGKIDRFLGVVPTSFDPKLINTWAEGPGSELGDRISNCAGSLEVVSAIEELASRRDKLAIAARCAYRIRDAAPLEAYTAAAREGYRSYIQAAIIDNVEEAVKEVQAIPGREPVFGDPSRIALPDEALLLQTASPDERALILYTFLQFSPTISEAEKSSISLSAESRGWAVMVGTQSLLGAEL